MSETVMERLQGLGLALPEPSKPGANYVPFVREGSLLIVTGQLAQWNGERRYIGKLGLEYDLAQGQAAARLAALNVVAQIGVACDGDFDRLKRILRVGVFVNATPDFDGHSQVANGASDLFIALFGEAGRHTRIAVGVSGLPYDVAVEVEAMAAID